MKLIWPEIQERLDSECGKMFGVSDSAAGASSVLGGSGDAVCGVWACAISPQSSRVASTASRSRRVAAIIGLEPSPVARLPVQAEPHLEHGGAQLLGFGGIDGFRARHGNSRGQRGGRRQRLAEA